MAEKTTIDGELKVKEILKERGIKMKDFAEQINMAPEVLTRTLKGNPQYSTLKTIADMLGVSVRDLFKNENQPVRDSEMQGCIFYNNETYIIKSKQDLINLANKIK